MKYASYVVLICLVQVTVSGLCCAQDEVEDLVRGCIGEKLNEPIVIIGPDGHIERIVYPKTWCERLYWSIRRLWNRVTQANKGRGH